MPSSRRPPVPSHRGSFPGRPSSGDTPHKSAACLHTQCRCGPFSQNARRPHRPPAAPRPIVVRWQDNKRTKAQTNEASLTQSQHGSPVPTLAAMLWKMSFMCGLKKTHSTVYNSSRDSWGVPEGPGFNSYEASQNLWNLTRPPCAPLAWARVRSAPLPRRHWLRCQQTATLSVSDSYSAAKGHKHGRCVRIYSAVKIHRWRAFLSPTVVSLYSELPPSMMISPASRRGTWGRVRGTDQLRQGSAQVIWMVWWRTGNPPVYQWSRPQPAQLWPAGWSSWVSSAWRPCPPETPLRSLWNPSPHSAGSRGPLTRFDCRHRPVERGLLIRQRSSWITRSQHRSWPYHEAMVIHVHDEVLAHDSQTDQCDVCSEEGTRVSTFSVAGGYNLNMTFPPCLPFFQMSEAAAAAYRSKSSILPQTVSLSQAG